LQKPNTSLNNPDKYDYGFRQLDPQICRWHVVDAMAEKYLSTSPYAYVENNPISFTDYMGLTKQWQNPDDHSFWDGVIFDHYLTRLNRMFSGGRGRGFNDYVASSDDFTFIYSASGKNTLYSSILILPKQLIIP
jgi:RHS repeat-associated protein